MKKQLKRQLEAIGMKKVLKKVVVTKKKSTGAKEQALFHDFWDVLQRQMHAALADLPPNVISRVKKGYPGGRNENHITFFAVDIFALPVSGFQGNQSDQWRQKELSELPGMSPVGSKYMLGSNEVQGVKGVAYLNDVQTLMNKYGLKNTHHIMVSFEDAATGQMLTTGSVEIRIIGPEDSKAEEKTCSVWKRVSERMSIFPKMEVSIRIRALLMMALSGCFSMISINRSV